MKLLISSCLMIWNIVLSQLAKAGDPVMETTKHIQISIIQGKTAILPCMINFNDVDDDERRKYSVIWTDRRDRTISVNENVIMNPRKFVISHPYPNEWNLRIVRVRSTDHGEYRCQVNSDPVQTKFVVVIVQVPPRIQRSEDVEVMETETLTIYCNATGNPPPTVTWYKDGEKLPGFTGEKLVIDKALRNNSGLYRCEAKNGIDPSNSEIITVNVLYSPTVLVATSRISQYRFKSIVLNCNVLANPTATISWIKNGQYLHDNWKYKQMEFEQSDGSQSHNLEISYLERLDFGDYICFAINQAGSDSEVISVTEITTSTVDTKSTVMSATLKPSKTTKQKTTTRITDFTTPYLDKTSSSKISLSSSSLDSVSYIPGKSDIVADNASVRFCSGNILLLINVMLCLYVDI
ncbi:protein CEPU-1-like [Ruditapes philippinarum]|uniref:protein CEPU-1-like n=1 Tax=Ruditapes philippinarum TaxID=129788 RepID=UPI00295ADF39|nr:protein CEPU-1-like [Ruditapes philippinarum]